MKSAPPLPDRPLRPAVIPGDEEGRLGGLTDRPLSSLAYVVFNTVTTGLDPSAESDILSLAGVRIENLRILCDQGFQSLVNPQRSIPTSSVPRHGISDGMVRGKPPIKVVLAQFMTFAGDAVLVAHNAALDQEALKRKGEKTTVRFDHGILDTLLLSMVVDPEATDHSLDGLCQRLGVPMRGQHTAMGVCLVTAQVLLRLLELLAAKGITTLGQAIAASAEVRL